jgi:succinate dehydrogenase/fumarate reductase cytochrome b subunit
VSKDLASLSQRIHAGLGIALLAFLAFHAWQVGAAPDGRWAFVARIEGSSLPLVVAAGLLVPIFAAHAVLGLRSIGAVRRGEEGAYETGAVRGIQIVAGVAVAAFVAFHLVHVFRLRFEGAAALDLYERLRDDLPRPAFALAYLGGATVASLHAGQGLTAAIRRTGRIRGSRARLVERGFGVVFASVIFFSFLDAISWFATGEGLFGGRPLPIEGNAP